MTNTSTKKRGIFLTIIYIYCVLLAVMLFVSGIIYPPMLLGLSSTAGKTTLIVSILEIIPLVLGLYGIWKWNKWGVYALFTYIAISIIATFVSDIVLKIYTGYAQYVIAFDVIEGAICFWAFSRKWSLLK